MSGGREEGPEALRIDRLAKTLGVARSGYYWHFESRGDYVEALLQHWAHEFTEVVVANRQLLEMEPRARILQTAQMVDRYDLGRYDLEGYLRRPGSGSGYIIGKIQLEKLLSERALALGEAFDLGTFHDDLLARGMIPLALVRWEMTGADDEVRPIWRRCSASRHRATSTASIAAR